MCIRDSFYTVLKYRRRPGDPDPPQIHGHTKLEIAWTIIPSIILIVVAVPTVITIFDNANSPEPSALTIEAKGHQWWFEFTYPHPEEPDKKVVTANEVHIPVIPAPTTAIDFPVSSSLENNCTPLFNTESVA